MSKPFPRTSPPPDLRQMNPAVEGRNHHDRARHGRKERKKDKEAERRKAHFSCRACKARRASSGTRSPFGVPQRLLSKETLASLGATRPGFAETGGSAGSYGPPSGEDLCAPPRALPAPACPSPASTSRAGHSAGRHDARAARVRRRRNLRPRAPQLAPPDGVTGWRPCKGARWRSLYQSREDVSSVVTAQGTIALIPRRFLLRRFLAPTAAWGEKSCESKNLRGRATAAEQALHVIPSPSAAGGAGAGVGLQGNGQGFKVQEAFG